VPISHSLTTAPTLYHRVPIKLFPDRQVLCAFREERIGHLAELNLMGKIAELDVLVIQSRVLCSPTAIYQGINRPLRVPQDPGWYDPERVVASVCKPAVGADMVNGSPAACIAPPNSVFLSLLRQVYDTGQRDQIRRILGGSEREVYILSWWEWVLADTGVPNLPDNHESRFREKWVWP
jgi:hypothetical protein